MILALLLGNDEKMIDFVNAHWFGHTMYSLALLNVMIFMFTI